MIQQNEKVALPGGVELEFQMPPLALALKLKRVVAGLVAGADVGNTKLGSLMAKGGFTLDAVSLGDVKNLVAAFLGSEQLDAVLMEIMQSGCLLSGVRIDKQTFETAEGREYYLPCAEEVGVRTLAPFFKHAGSLLSGLGSLTKTPSQT